MLLRWLLLLILELRLLNHRLLLHQRSLICVLSVFSVVVDVVVKTSCDALVVEEGLIRLSIGVDI